MASNIFLVDTGGLEDVKSVLDASAIGIENSILGLDNTISSMEQNGWVGPDYDVYSEDYLNRKGDLQAAESYIKAYSDLINSATEKAVTLSEKISEACNIS